MLGRCACYLRLLESGRLPKQPGFGSFTRLLRQMRSDHRLKSQLGLFRRIRSRARRGFLALLPSRLEQRRPSRRLR